jgi:hypothetical protein
MANREIRFAVPSCAMMWGRAVKTRTHVASARYRSPSRKAALDHPVPVEEISLSSRSKSLVRLGPRRDLGGPSCDLLSQPK